MNMTKAKAASEFKSENSLTAILFLLQRELERTLDEVDNSYNLFTKVGKKTELAVYLENVSKNPLGNMIDISKKIDAEIINIIEKYVSAFMIQQKSKLTTVLKSCPDNNKLYYSIVLKEDTTENRLAIFDFLDKYELLGISDKFPIQFQFVPDRLISKINYKEQLELN